MKRFGIKDVLLAGIVGATWWWNQKQKNKQMSEEIAHIPSSLDEIAQTAAVAETGVIDGNQMIGEGAQTTTNYYNKQQDDMVK